MIHEPINIDSLNLGTGSPLFRHAIDKSKSYAEVAFPYSLPTDVFKRKKGLKRQMTQPSLIATDDMFTHFGMKM